MLERGFHRTLFPSPGPINIVEGQLATLCKMRL